MATIEHDPKEGCDCDLCGLTWQELNDLSDAGREGWVDALERDPGAWFTPMLAAHPSSISEDRPLTFEAAS